MRRKLLISKEPYLNVSPASVQVAADGSGTYIVSVESNVTWDVSVT